MREGFAKILLYGTPQTEAAASQLIQRQQWLYNYAVFELRTINIYILFYNESSVSGIYYSINYACLTQKVFLAMPLVLASQHKQLQNSSYVNNYTNYIVNLAWLQASKTEPQQFQYSKVVFLIILNVPLRTVFQRQSHM